MEAIATLSKPNRFGGVFAREAARGLGVSAKTLRVYEEAGLLAPARAQMPFSADIFAFIQAAARSAKAVTGGDAGA